LALDILPVCRAPYVCSHAMNKLLIALREYRSREVALLFPLGFGSGVPLLLVLSTLTMWLSEAGLQKAGIAAFQYVGTAWAIKFLWAPSVDRMPIPWLTARVGQRRSWMIVGQLGIAGGLFAMSFLSPQASLPQMALLCVWIATFSATYDIALDGWRVAVLTDEQQGAGSSAIQLGYRVAMLMTGAGALFLADALRSDPPGAIAMARQVAGHAANIAAEISGGRAGTIMVPNLHLAEEIWPKVYRILASLMGISLIATIFAKEPHDERDDEEQGGVLQQVRAAVVEPFTAFFEAQGGMKLALLTLGFVLFFRLSDSIAGSLMNPFLNELGFPYSEIARITKVFGFIATILGIALGGTLFRVWGATRTLWVAAVVQTASNLLFVLQAQVGADPLILHFTIGIENVSGGLGAAAFVAWLSTLCEKRYSATQYALLSSLAMVGRTLVAGSVGGIADHYGWVVFFVFSTVAGVPGILLLWILQRARKREAASLQQATGG